MEKTKFGANGAGELLPLGDVYASVDAEAGISIFSFF
jgi:hypothetical protein